MLNHPNHHLKLGSVMRRVGKRISLIGNINGDNLCAAASNEGEILLTEDLLSILEEGELIFCVCHELAHVSLGHFEATSQFQENQIQVGIEMIKSGKPENIVLAKLKSEIVALYHQHEYEADKEGALTAVGRLSVRGEECVSALRKIVEFADSQQRGYLQFLSSLTHPPIADRIDRIAIMLLKRGYLK